MTPAATALSLFFAVTVATQADSHLSTTSNNAATAVILAPVAWMAAQGSGISPTKAFLAVAYGTSCAFLLPFAHQCNLMVMGPAAYETRDFVRAGLGMSVVVAIGTITLLSIL